MVIGNHIGLPFGKHKGVPKPPITEVIWNPNVTSNVSPINTQFFNLDGSVLENGTVVSVGAKVYVKVTFEEGADVELHGVTINGTSLVLESTPTGDMYAWTVDVRSPQQVVIDASEFIRYEDIVQPYPAIINLKQDGKTITWGDKLKVGSEVTFVNHTNLLPDLYTVSGGVQYNGTFISWNTSIRVEKSMVFVNPHNYKKANEPNCILAPQTLRIPNSSYKILGYIPDLTGKGNHGRLNNFAYAGMSGANGYVEDFTKWSKNSSLDDVEITYDRIKVNKLTRSTVLYVTSNKFINKIKIVASGIPNGGKLTFTQYPDNAIENNKEFEIGGVTTTGSWGFSIKEGLNLDWSNLVIQQIGEHEGSICFDGVDDYITIPTLAHGGKCVMMKVNSFETVNPIYEQRNPNIFSPTFCIFMNSGSIVYVDGNNGKTYIDGVLNSSITGNNLVNILHNITVTNENVTTANSVSPKIGVLNTTNTSYADMAMYEFMLFPEIPSEDEIKELNEVMGIEGGYVESPNYYWDAYGKKNTDTDRNLIADQVSKDVANALEVKNVAYNSESGYGYGKSNFISIMESSQQFVDIIDDYNFIIKATPHNNNQFFAQVNTPKLIPNNYIRFKVSGMPEDFKMVFGYDYVEGGTNKYSHIIDKNGVYSYDSFNIFYTSFRAYTGYTDLTGLNIKVEFLDYHPNGLLLDGVEDHAVNTVIPAVTDFTVIAKREWLGDYQPSAAFVTKGTSNTYTKAAFMMEFKSSASIQIGSFGILNSGQNMPDLITYMTPIDYNKAGLSKGTAIDENGLIMGKYSNTYYWKGVFYKLMFYTKTIDQLSINMLKNLFALDILIDINHPIFKK